MILRLAAALAMTVAWTPVSVQAQAVACSLQTREAVPGGVAYGPRQDRCEGVFIENVSGRINLRIVGYQANRFPPAMPAEVRFDVPGVGTGDAPRLVVVSTRPSDYYQMDTAAVTSGRYLWPTDILSALTDPPKGRYLAVLACSQNCGGEAVDVPLFHPVIIGDAAADDRATLLVMSDVDLKALKVTIRDESSGAVLSEQEVPTDFVPARRAQRFTVTGPPEGVGRVLIEAETHNGRRDTFEARLWPIAKP